MGNEGKRGDAFFVMSVGGFYLLRTHISKVETDKVSGMRRKGGLGRLERGGPGVGMYMS